MTIASIAFAVSGFAENTFEVVSLSGQEALSSPFLFDLTLVSANAAVDGAVVVGKAATLTLRSKRGGDPELAVPYYGIVTRFEQHQQVGSNTAARVYYQARMQPQLSRLAATRTSAVYVDPSPDQPSKTVKDVITDVFTRARSISPDLKYEFRQVEDDKLRKRAYRCQFEESDLDFISRLMEAEGLYYFFEHSVADKDKLIITSRREAHPDAPRHTVTMRPSGGLGVDDDMLFSFVGRQKMLPGKVVLRDYNYEKADSGVLKKEAAVHSQGAGEVMLYGEDFLTEAEGGVLATLRAQELACRGKQYLAEGSATGLRAGYLVKLTGHFNTDLNSTTGDPKKYLVVDIAHSAAVNVPALAGDPQAPKATTYIATITAIPFTDKFDGLDVQFRPQRVTPKPRIHGTISAKIDDDTTGQYASIDAKGRYKVLLPFVDNTGRNPGKGSAWIRMAAPYSGGGAFDASNKALSQVHGMHFPLHKGAEVLLSFLDGDPDRPIIVGAAPNSQNQSVIKHDSEKQSLIQTAGGNHILINDEKDAEGIMIGTPYQGSYLRVGKAFKDEAGMDPGEEGIKNPEKVGMAMYTHGDGLQYFTGSFISITGVGETKPVFGKLDWQIKWGWDKDVAFLTDSDTELNMKNNITHTKADNIERTLGNSYSTTRGNTEEETHGNTTEETHGDSDSTVRGNTKEDVWGNALSSHMGATEEFFFGNQLAIGLSNSFEMTLGATEEFMFGYTFSLALGLKTEFDMAKMVFSTDETEVKLNELKATMAVTDSATIELAQRLSKVASTASKIQNTVNDIDTKVSEINSKANAISTAATTINSGGPNISANAITLIA